MAKSASAKVIQPEQWKPAAPIRRKINLRTPVGKQAKHSVEVRHSGDPKQELLDRVGPLPDDIVQGSRILVAIYQPPMVAKTQGGIFLPQAMSDEDVEEYVWQGKVGLVIAMGSKAYVDDEANKFDSRNAVGDWVWFMPSNGHACEVNGVFCRTFNSEIAINGKIPHPDFIW